MQLALERVASNAIVGNLPKELFIPMQRAIHHVVPQIRRAYLDYRERSKNYKTLTFDHDFQKYLKEIEEITHRPLHDQQVKDIKYHLDNYTYSRLPSNESQQHRREFNGLKHDIVADWEKMTGINWPTYDKPVYNKSGKMIRQIGGRFDMHHIIENCYGGDNAAWNMHPARHPEEHQEGIHGKGRMANKIFEN